MKKTVATIAAIVGLTCFLTLSVTILYSAVNAEGASPNEQADEGNAAEEMHCDEGLELVIRISGRNKGLVTCVKPATAKKLIARGVAQYPSEPTAATEPTVVESVPAETPLPDPDEKPTPERDDAGVGATPPPDPDAQPTPEQNEAVEAEVAAAPPQVIDFTTDVAVPDKAAHAVDLLGAWVNANAPESASFDYTGYDGKTHKANFITDILPLFTKENLWYSGAPACSSCHHADLENSFHEMDLTSYAGLMAGGDRLEEAPGVPLFGESKIGATDFDWAHSKLRGRLRNNRMPPGAPFDITEANRDGRTLMVTGTPVKTVDLLGAWLDASAPETKSFGDYEATFGRHIQLLFTTKNSWYLGSPRCSSCHHSDLESSFHEMDLTSYEGLLAGGDRLSEPPGVPLFGESAIGETDFDWDHSKLNGRLRNNRMPPGMPFDITEANRDGPLVLHGQPVEILIPTALGTRLTTGDCRIKAVHLLAAWVQGRAPNGEFTFEGHEGAACEGDFATDILPLFTEDNMWYAGSPACGSCHHDDLEESYHEMDLTSYEGLMAGGDRLSEPPGVPLFGQSKIGGSDFDWENSKLRGRLRNNRMPPGAHFDITEANRDGPPLVVKGASVNAVDLLAAWVDAGAPETIPFGDYDATFEEDIQPLFTEADVWYPDAPACGSCHHADLESSFHEMDLTSYAGLMAGGDRLEDPPGVPLFGESAIGERDFDWENSKLRGRLRDNRMPPGMPFDITEANRDGPFVQVGFVKGTERGSVAQELSVPLEPPDIEVVDKLVRTGGCQACHIIPGIEDAVGVVGPTWCEPAHDYQSGEKGIAFLYDSIVNPNNAIEEGYAANVMPQNFAEIYSEEKLDILVAFIATLDCQASVAQ